MGPKKRTSNKPKEEETERPAVRPKEEELQKISALSNVNQVMERLIDERDQTVVTQLLKRRRTLMEDAMDDCDGDQEINEDRGNQEMQEEESEDEPVLDERELKKQKDKMTIRHFKQQNIPRFIDKDLKEGHVKNTIKGVDVFFPRKPYKKQVAYMEKLFQCYQSGKNGLLQSPTGTGKTLALLCATLAWIAKQKKEIGCHRRVIYLARTHSQLSQAIQELKKTCYRPTMIHVGSREHTCIKKFQKPQKPEDAQDIQDQCKMAIKLLQQYKKKALSEHVTKEQKDDLRQRSCEFFKQKQVLIQLGKHRFANRPLTLPEMTLQGQNRNFCPYFYQYSFLEHVDMLFMPYNYLLHPAIRKIYKQLLGGSIIIFDEAHNIPEAACKGLSYDLTLKDLQNAKKEISNILENGGKKPKKSKKTKNAETKMQNQEEQQQNKSKKKKHDEKNMQNQEQQQKKIFLSQLDPETIDALETIEESLRDVETNVYQYLNQIPFREAPKKQQKLYNGQKDNSYVKVIRAKETQLGIYELFNGRLRNREIFDNINERKRLASNFCSRFLGLSQKIEEVTDALSDKIESSLRVTNKIGKVLKKIAYMLVNSVNATLDWFNNELNHFRLVMQVDMDPEKEKVFKGFKLELRCLVSWLNFRKIMKYAPKSIIFTSGTLTPFQIFQDQLGIEAPIRLANNHVINVYQQVRPYILKRSMANTAFDFRYNTIKQTYKTAYNQTCDAIVQITSIIPKGVLIGCPNFRIVDKIYSLLKSQYYQARLRKTVVREEKSNDTFLEEYKSKALTGHGAILVFVCRGRVSQGIDFPDDLCRGVIMVGVPIPNPFDPITTEKIDHFQLLASMSSASNNIPCVNWQQWSNSNAMRAVNQALGRVIRHKHDYGMLFLLDFRYDQRPQLKSLISSWIKQSGITVCQHWGTRMLDNTRRFFDENSIRYPIVDPNNQIKEEEKESQELENILLNQTLTNNFLKTQAPTNRPQVSTSRNSRSARGNIKIQQKGQTKIESFFKKKK